MNSKKIISIFLLTFIAVNHSLIILVVADSDYTLGFGEDVDIVWEVDVNDDTLIQQLATLYPDDYDVDDFNVEVGEQIMWRVYDKELYSGVDSDYYKIKFKYYVGDDLHSSSSGYIDDFYSNIPLDPEALADDWRDGLGDTWGIVVIAIDTEDFLEAFDNAIPPGDHTRVYVEGSTTIVIDRTVDARTYKVKMKFDEKGIQEEYELYHNGELAYKDSLVGVYGDTFEIPIIVFVFIGIFVFGAVAAGISSARRRRLGGQGGIRKTPSTDKPAIDTPSSQMGPQGDYFKELDQPTSTPIVAPIKETPKVVGVCELCGTERDSDAVFCHSCGARF